MMGLYVSVIMIHCNKKKDLKSELIDFYFSKHSKCKTYIQDLNILYTEIKVLCVLYNTLFKT